MQIVYALAALGLGVYALLVWLLGSLLKLQGGDLLVLRLGLGVIGIAAAAVAVLLLLRKKKSQPTPTAPDGLRGDVRFLVREANARLAAARQIHKAGVRMADLPLVLFLGDPGTTKTTLIVNSGLAPELLAGQVYQDSAVIPTRVANFWLGGGLILVEAGGDLVADRPALVTLVRSLRARRLANLLGRGAQSPRSVVLCCDCASLNGPDARNAVASAARRYQDILAEIAHNWGSRVPVYVVFTRLDQVPYFLDYFRFFTTEESAQAFGANLALTSQDVSAAYNERQNQRLTQEFESLFFGLAEARLDFLRRENDLAKTPNVYEFPREFRKMRDNLVRFLLDVGRPSQLRATPFLRGFYFTGVRPVIVEDAGAAPAAPEPLATDPAATRFFAPGVGFQSAPPPSARIPGVRRAPDWVFLRNFVAKVVLGDRAARGTSGSDTRAALIRRFLWGTAAAAGLVWLTGATVSYFKLRDLAGGAAGASRALAVARISAGQPPARDALEQLDKLREAAAEVSAHRQYRPPMSFRWAVYPGQPLYDRTRAAYCREFGRLLLGDAHASIEAYLKALPSAPGPNDDYERPFRALKAYLMMTLRPGKADPAFLGSALTDAWQSTRPTRPEQSSLARNQFDFYGAERSTDMCPSRADDNIVEHTRVYLLGFQQEDRIYKGILAAVAPGGQSVRFVDPQNAVRDPQEVQYPFTKGAWSRVQAAIRDATSYLGRDAWVIGGASGAPASPQLQAKLRQRYSSDYIAQWQQFLNAASVSSYRDLSDAARKLNTISSAQSSLLQLFCVISANTAVDAPEIVKEFKPIQDLEPPATCASKLIDAPSQQYIGEMVRLQAATEEAAKKPEPAEVTIDSSSAKVAARAAGIPLPAKAGYLLLDPIYRLDELSKSSLPKPLNDAGSDFCQTTRSVFGSFPFRRDSPQDARLEDFNRVFQPGTGQLAKLVEEKLKDLVVFDNVRYSRKSGARLQVTQQYLEFLNRSAAISRAFYPGNATTPALNYYVQMMQSSGIERFELMLDGKAMRGGVAPGQPQDFVWRGLGGISSLTAEAKEKSAPLNKVGTWALFHLLALASNQLSGSVFEYEVSGRVSIGRSNSTKDPPQGILRLKIDGKDTPGVFNLVFGLSCVSKIAQ